MKSIPRKRGAGKENCGRRLETLVHRSNQARNPAIRKKALAKSFLAPLFGEIKSLMLFAPFVGLFIFTHKAKVHFSMPVSGAERQTIMETKNIHLNEQGEMIVGLDSNDEPITQAEADYLEARADLATHGD